MSKLLETYRAARLRGVPIVAVATPDQPATVQALREAEFGRDAAIPVFVWDLATGLRPLGDAARVFLLRLFGFDPDLDPEPEPGSDAEKTLLRFQAEVRKATVDPDATLLLAKQLPGHDAESGRLGSMLVVLNAQAVLDRDFPTHAAVRQAVANLREPFKKSSRMLVLLGPEMTLPAELANDVIPLREEYPDDAALTAIITEQVAGVGLPTLDADTLAKAVDAVRGLSAFVAEQVVVMSLKRGGLDIEALRERKYAELEKIPGLKVVRERVTFDMVGGKAQAKKMLRREFTGRRKPGMIVILDEFEKVMAGSGANGAQGDANGLGAYQESVVLTQMEDHKYNGMMLTSPPGVGKTLLALAVAGEFNVMAIRLDMGATRSKWVGESEANLNAAFRVIEATAGPGGAFFEATTNGQASISPAMRRRFTRGIWYDDLPDASERDDIWKIQLRAYGLPLDSKRPNDAGWTGADIRNCCDLAWAQNIPLTEAADFLVPVSKSDPRKVEELRATAKGSFLSTAYPGPYKGPEGGAKPPARGTVLPTRRARVDDDA